MITRRHTITALAGLTCASLFNSRAFAHRQKTTWTELKWKAHTKTLNATHRYHTHDAQNALALAGIISAPDLLPLKSRAKLALYTEKNFRLMDSQRELKLATLGAEHDGNSIYVYQQIALNQAPTSLDISAQMLQDLIPSQINRVAVNLAGRIQSLEFTKGDGLKTVLA